MAAGQFKTNRDLYLFIRRLREVTAYHDRDLEEYLRALWQLGSKHKTEEALPLGVFAELIESAFRESAPPFDPSWRNLVGPRETKREGFGGWQDTILWQIVDLRDMDEAGMLRNEMRYFGINAPRGNRWYNFDPMTYLECAAAGTCGGVRDGDGRKKVHPDVPDDPVIEIPDVSWDGFTDFLWAGQHYE
jgi:hypothetical protein